MVHRRLVSFDDNRARRTDAWKHGPRRLLVGVGDRLPWHSQLAREVDYDDALAEISDEIANRPDVDRWQLDDALERIDRTPDCQTFDDLRVGGKTYMIEEVGPEIDASTEDRELEARFQEAMRQSDRALGYEP